ncbi:hypothetical protein DFP72DRAFT_939147 [Ephemerocybe angulata]|uniref:Uncharacterized protein n=1 Tax=Ephemerocybe angulata TaxID=980116 RepID=A0A8H6H9R9_9AGAR|nr:hypothetical protein DFP72DRAFT_939147 [Tulosesus angulatus]
MTPTPTLIVHHAPLCPPTLATDRPCRMLFRCAGDHILATVVGLIWPQAGVPLASSFKRPPRRPLTRHPLANHSPLAVAAPPNRAVGLLIRRRRHLVVQRAVEIVGDSARNPHHPCTTAPTSAPHALRSLCTTHLEPTCCDISHVPRPRPRPGPPSPCGEEASMAVVVVVRIGRHCKAPVAL